LIEASSSELSVTFKAFGGYAMSILASLNTGVSGIQANGTAMGIIGDNIANAGTTGFKASRGEFQDVVAASLKGILGGNQIGRGTRLAGVTSIFSQGNLGATQRDSDMAIRGDGFFVLKNKDTSAFNYTRDGSLRFDDKGRLTSSDGHMIQGYKIDRDNGKVKGDLTDIVFSSNTIPARGTAQAKINLNLDSRTVINKFPFEIEKADSQADLTSVVRIYDTTGTAQSVNMHFYKSGETSWNWYATADGAVLQGGTEGKMQKIAEGQLTFSTDGKLLRDELKDSNISFRGATANQKVDFYFGDAIETRRGTGSEGATHYGSPSQVFKQVQDGYSGGTLSNFSVDESGTISGTYTNGITRPLAKIALARFENNEGLFKMGQNRFGEAVLSGAPLVGMANEGGRGAILTKTLENSNVDIASEFVDMIKTQRNFQANAKTVTTSDELLQEVINLKR
jgi:flagellar hook protein FlgE